MRALVGCQRLGRRFLASRTVKLAASSAAAFSTQASAHHTDPIGDSQTAPRFNFQPVDRWESLDKNLRFLLYDVVDCQRLCDTPRYEIHDKETLDAFLQVCAAVR